MDYDSSLDQTKVRTNELKWRLVIASECSKFYVKKLIWTPAKFSVNLMRGRKNKKIQQKILETQIFRMQCNVVNY